MADYFRDSQYNILADWSDEQLLELAGTNEAVDVEIESRGLNGGIAGAISEPYEDTTKSWENYLYNKNLTKDFNQYFGGSQGEGINQRSYPGQGRTLRTPIRDTIASTGVDYPFSQYRKNMGITRDIQEGQSTDRFFGNTTAALQDQWRNYQDQGGKLKQAVNRFNTPSEDYGTFRAQVGEQPTGGGGFERGDYGGRGFHWSRGGLIGYNRGGIASLWRR